MIYALTGHLITYTLLVTVGIPFLLSDLFSFLWHKFQLGAENILQILIHVDMTASHICWRFVSCTQGGYTVVLKGNIWSAPILKQSVALKQWSVGTKGTKVCQDKIPKTITPSTVWCVDARQDGSLLLYCFPTINIVVGNDSSDQATFLQSSTVLFWWTHVNCILNALFSAVAPGMVYLLQGSEILFCMPWL